MVKAHRNRRQRPLRGYITLPTVVQTPKQCLFELNGNGRQNRAEEANRFYCSYDSPVWCNSVRGLWHISAIQLLSRESAHFHARREVGQTAEAWKAKH